MDRSQFAHFRPPLGTMVLFGGLTVASQVAAGYYNLTRSRASALRVARHLLRYAADCLAGWPRGTRLANGNAIVARLAQAVVTRRGQIMTGWAVTRLVLRNGRVAGTSGPQGTIAARAGVILATGGLNASAAARTDLFGTAPHVATPAQSDVVQLAYLVVRTGTEIVASVSQPVLWGLRRWCRRPCPGLIHGRISGIARNPV